MEIIMQLPLFFVSFLPEKLREAAIQREWDNKSDEVIMFAYKQCGS
jgi:hypothetical protein